MDLKRYGEDNSTNFTARDSACDEVSNCGQGYIADLDIAKNYRQMQLMRSQCSRGDSQNHDIAAAIVVADRNLKPWHVMQTE